MKGIFIKLPALLSAAALLVSCGRADIDPNDYLEVRFSGLDTTASADYDIDYAKMVADNSEYFGVTEKNSAEAAERAADDLGKYLNGAPDRDSMLSNGDVITFEWSRDGVQQLEEKYKIRLSVSDKDITVSGLEEAKPFDPFEYLSVGFRGTEPEGVIELDYEGLPVRDVPFSAERCSGLRNGDKVRVSFGSGSEEEIRDKCFNQAYIPVCFEKEYTVSGLQHYVTRLSDIGSDSYKRMDSYAQEEFGKLADKHGDWKCTDIQLLGADLYTPAEGEAKWGRNAFCLVYEVTSEKSDSGKKGDKKQEKKESITYYYFTYFLNTVSPDNDKNAPFPAECAVFPSYSEFYTSIYGDAFKVGDTVFEGYRTLGELEEALSDCFENSICETDINNEE